RGGAGGGLGASWADGVALQCGGAGRRGIQAFVPLGCPTPARGPGKGAGERLQRSACEFLRKPPPFGGGSADAGRLLAGKRRLKPLLPPRLSLHLPDEFHDLRRQSRVIASKVVRAGEPNAVEIGLFPFGTARRSGGGGLDAQDGALALLLQRRRDRKPGGGRVGEDPVQR